MFGSSDFCSGPRICVRVLGFVSGPSDLCPGPRICVRVLGFVSGFLGFVFGSSDLCSGFSDLCPGFSDLCPGFSDLCPGFSDLCSGPRICVRVVAKLKIGLRSHLFVCINQIKKIRDFLIQPIGSIRVNGLARVSWI